MLPSLATSPVLTAETCVAGIVIDVKQSGGLGVRSLLGDSKEYWSLASFPAPMHSRWFKTYGAAHPNVEVDYQSVGSGSGIKSFITGDIHRSPYCSVAGMMLVIILCVVILRNSSEGSEGGTA